MPIVNGASISWGNLWQSPRESRVQRAGSATAGQRAAAAPSQAVSTEVRAEPILAAPAAVLGSTSSLLNLYHQALSVEATGQNQSWVAVPPPQETGEAHVPEAAARTSAEASARAAYALVANASRSSPARLSREG